MSLELDAIVEAFEAEEALDDSGYVLIFGTTVSQVLKAEDDSEFILGFSYMSTKNPISGTAEADKQVGVIKPRNGLVVRVPLTPKANRDVDITVGMPLVVDNAVDGTVESSTDTQGGAAGSLRVGYAREACLAAADTTDGKIEVEVKV